MNDNFSAAMKAATAIVAGYRAQAPCGLDPVNLGGDSSPQVNYQEAIDQVVAGLGGTANQVENLAGAGNLAYQGQEQNQLETMLFGGPGGQVQSGTTNQWYNPATGATSNTEPTQIINNPIVGYSKAGPLYANGQEGPSGSQTTVSAPGWVDRSVPAYTTTPATPGYVNMLGQLNSSAGTINPQGASLVNQLYQDTSSDLAQGYNPGPGLARNVSQGILASNVGTLGGTGDVGAYNLALGMSAFGQQLYQQRVSNAGAALSANQSFYGNLDNSLPAFGSGMITQSGPGSFNPNPFAQSVAASNLNAQATTQASNANSNAALAGAGISALASLATL
jgi:hypothetical protein